MLYQTKTAHKLPHEEEEEEEGVTGLWWCVFAVAAGPASFPRCDSLWRNRLSGIGHGQLRHYFAQLTDKLHLICNLLGTCRKNQKTKHGFSTFSTFWTLKHGFSYFGPLGPEAAAFGNLR